MIAGSARVGSGSGSGSRNGSGSGECGEGEGRGLKQDPMKFAAAKNKAL